MKAQDQELLGYLSIIQDPRIERSKLHKLEDVLFLVVCAVLCGCDTWEAIYEFGKDRVEWLRKYIRLEHGIPSADTLARVFSLIDPEEFEQAFRNWVFSLYEVKDEQIIAIDGKRVRNTHDNRYGRGAIHMVSAYATEVGLVLGQVKTADKSNEIRAVPELLDALKLKGCVITLDAMGCQKDIVKKITERGGDYVISLKGNQGQLHQDVKLFFESIDKGQLKKVKLDSITHTEKGHGRIEERCYQITDHIDWLENKANWSGLRSIGRVDSMREINGVVSRESRYFISSLPGAAQRFSKAVRQHWAIENNLHWQLDVTFNEDKLRARMRNAAQNLTILRRMILNVLKQDKTSKASLNIKRMKAGWNNQYLLHMLALLFKF
jgi:predicted transposase YbfD/YdcC